jgi:hypothetical protein
MFAPAHGQEVREVRSIMDIGFPEVTPEEPNDRLEETALTCIDRRKKSRRAGKGLHLPVVDSY